MTTDEKQLQPLKDFCRLLSISTDTASREVKRGKLRLTKVGKRTFVDREDRKAYLASLPKIEAHAA